MQLIINMQELGEFSLRHIQNIYYYNGYFFPVYKIHLYLLGIL